MLLKCLYSVRWDLMLCIHFLCREIQSLVRDLWLSPCKMKRENTCQEISLMEEICFLQWDILWVAEWNIFKILSLPSMHLYEVFNFLLPILKQVCIYGNYFETVLLGCLFSDTLLSVNRLFVSHTDKWICQLNHKFLTVI